ncbi:mechanosensitive ion channel protein 10-like [Argentina anserina]|uniref:mechanosensitive ion channel protein 10-like n=1 Tax=Argentina anserina TaxID=57926 RepID=UPI0021767FF7|nr:mechanosensitive ion channel protein 10-like [Potentilla anserina]
MEMQHSADGGQVVLEVGRDHKRNEPTGSDSSAGHTLIKRKSLSRSVLSKPKSRFGETLPIMHEESREESPNGISLVRTKSSSSARIASPPLTPGRTKDEEEEDEEIYNKVRLSRTKRSKVNKKVLVEFLVFLCILSCLLASLTVHELRHSLVLGLKIWRWCVLVMVVLCGMLMTGWVTNFLVFVIERNYLLRKKVLYFVYGLKTSFQILLWWTLVLLTWLLLIRRGFRRGLQQSQISDQIVTYITRSIIALVIGAFLWLLKTLFVKIISSKFHVIWYFDRIQESLFHQYVLSVISGPPLMKEAYKLSQSSGKLSFRGTKEADAEGKEKEVVDMAKVKEHGAMMDFLVNIVTNSALSTVSQKMEDLGDEEGENEITSEAEATAAAYDIFLNVARHGAKYIEKEDLLRFMTKGEVDVVWPFFDVAMTGQVDRKFLTDWVVKVYTARKALAHALADTKIVTAQVDNLVTSIVLIIIIVVSLLVVEVATTSFFVFLSSQLVLAAFAFGNTCKNVFESIMFLYVAHPYDVGDCIVFEGVPMIVEEMNIFTTVFLKLSNNEKVYYPNSVLSATSISNYSRSPDMKDVVEFSIALTPVEKITQLKEKVKEYIEGKPQYWYRKHNVAVIDIQDVDKLKMAVYCQHKMNFTDFEEKNLRRAELNFELLKILEELNITVISAVLPNSESHSN